MVGIDGSKVDESLVVLLSEDSANDDDETVVIERELTSTTAEGEGPTIVVPVDTNCDDVSAVEDCCTGSTGESTPSVSTGVLVELTKLLERLLNNFLLLEEETDSDVESVLLIVPVGVTVGIPEILDDVGEVEPDVTTGPTGDSTLSVTPVEDPKLLSRLEAEEEEDISSAEEDTPIDVEEVTVEVR